MLPVLLAADSHYAAVRADLESDAQDLELESWSLTVDQQYMKTHSKEMVKRQDVIYGESKFMFTLAPAVDPYLKELLIDWTVLVKCHLNAWRLEN